MSISWFRIRIPRAKTLCVVAACAAVLLNISFSVAYAGDYWGEEIQLWRVENDYADYVALTPTVAGDGPYTYTYQVTSWANYGVGMFVLSVVGYPLYIPDPQSIKATDLSGNILAGWSGQSYALGNNFKVEWTGLPEIMRGQSANFTFTCLNQPQTVPVLGRGAAAMAYSNTAIEPDKYYDTSGGNPVPEPSTLFAAIGILGPIGLLGRRVFK
jgi:hypothetical protein